MIINYKENIDIIFKNDCNAIFDEKILKKAICWYSKKPVCRIKHIYMYGNYPAISIYTEKIHIHRLIKMYQLGTDIDNKFYVHHKDGNKLNASINNLELITVSEHQSLHNKNKELSSEQKMKISKSNKKRRGIKYKKRVNMENLKEYLQQGLSINKIAKIYNCGWNTVKSRIHENKELLK